MDPKDMSDEELDAALQGDPNTNPNEDPSGGDPGEQSPPAQDEPGGPARGPDGRFVKQDDEPEPGEQPDVPGEQEPQHQPAEEKPPSRREQLRIQQLLERYPQGQQQPQQQPAPQSARQGAINYAEELDADPEVIARLEEDRRTAENARYQEGLKQAQAYEWRTLLQVDAPMMERDHPQLDKNSPEFHPAITHSLSTMYLQMSGYDKQTGLASSPGMRWSEFVPAIWELADEIANLKTQQVRQQVTQQAANTGIRPDGSATKLNLNKDPEHMSDAELDAYLAGQGLAPTKRR